MAQTSYYHEVGKTGVGNANNMIRQIGLHAFSTADTSVSLSTTLKAIFAAFFQPQNATYKTADGSDLLFCNSANGDIPNSRKLKVYRKATGTSSLKFYYELIGY